MTTHAGPDWRGMGKRSTEPTTEQVMEQYRLGFCSWADPKAQSKVVMRCIITAGVGFYFFPLAKGNNQMMGGGWIVVNWTKAACRPAT